MEKGWTIRSFSINLKDLEYLQKLREIGLRENKSQSEMIVIAVKEFVKKHSIPNPQAQLDRLLQIQMPHKPSWQCCVENCHTKALFHLFLKNFEGKTECFPVCWRHRRWKHPQFRWLVGRKKLK